MSSTKISFKHLGRLGYYISTEREKYLKELSLDTLILVARRVCLIDCIITEDNVVSSYDGSHLDDDLRDYEYILCRFGKLGKGLRYLPITTNQLVKGIFDESDKDNLIFVICYSLSILSTPESGGILAELVYGISHLLSPNDFIALCHSLYYPYEYYETGDYDEDMQYYKYAYRPVTLTSGIIAKDGTNQGLVVVDCTTYPRGGGSTLPQDSSLLYSNKLYYRTNWYN